MSVDPVVSVCLITYNQAGYVSKALDSILAQDFVGQWEIVIADDVSTDGTTDILRDYQSKHPALIRLLDRPKNLGPGPNFVDLLLQAKGKYIAYLEGDDFWVDASKLTKQVTFLEKNPNIALTWHNYHIIDENGAIVKPRAADQSKKDYTPLEFKQINSLKSLTICFRNAIRQFPDNYLDCPNGDTFLYVLLGAHGGAAYLENIEPSCYRVHSSGTWSLISQLKKDKKAVQSYRVIADYLKKTDDQQSTEYYIDRLFKSLYVLAYHYRSENNWSKFFGTYINAIAYIARYKKIKWLPAVTKFFAIIGSKNILPIWSHRSESLNP
jgi:glycosyltransferase involved in cell wall biosynthesis